MCSLRFRKQLNGISIEPEKTLQNKEPGRASSGASHLPDLLVMVRSSFSPLAPKLDKGQFSPQKLFPSFNLRRPLSFKAGFCNHGKSLPPLGQAISSKNMPNSVKGIISFYISYWAHGPTVAGCKSQELSPEPFPYLGRSQ